MKQADGVIFQAQKHTRTHYHYSDMKVCSVPVVHGDQQSILGYCTLTLELIYCGITLVMKYTKNQES